jgi:small GTP-binding protein
MDNLKISFVGLDSSGKTTIISTLENKFTIPQTRPTLGVERHNLTQTQWLGISVQSFDLGGQKALRKNHLINPMLFANLNALFFLIDLQDAERFQEALEYLQAIIKKLSDIKENPRIVILINKFDPFLHAQPAIKQSIEDLQQKITDITKGFQIIFRTTSIHDPSSIADAFYEGVIKLSPKSQLISKVLKEYAEMTKSSAVILLDESLLIVGSETTVPNLEETCQDYLSKLYNTIEKSNIDKITKNVRFSPDSIPRQSGKGLFGTFHFQKFACARGLEFYLLTL